MSMRSSKPSDRTGLSGFTPANFREAPDCAGRRKPHMLTMARWRLRGSLVKVCYIHVTSPLVVTARYFGIIVDVEEGRYYR